MENMDLNNAEVAVTTQHILDGKEYKDYWVQMSDYSDMGEFLCACFDLFPEEEEPEYRYTKWENIPDRLINREWICPNFFEIRDAMERLDESEREYFVTWSEHFGYDITTDDPHMMVSHYQDIYGNTIQETEEELADIADDALLLSEISDNSRASFPSCRKYLYRSNRSALSNESACASVISAVRFSCGSSL